SSPHVPSPATTLSEMGDSSQRLWLLTQVRDVPRHLHPSLLRGVSPTSLEGGKSRGSVLRGVPDSRGCRSGTRRTELVAGGGGALSLEWLAAQAVAIEVVEHRPLLLAAPCPPGMAEHDPDLALAEEIVQLCFDLVVLGPEKELAEGDPGAHRVAPITVLDVEAI